MNAEQYQPKVRRTLHHPMILAASTIVLLCAAVVGAFAIFALVHH